MTNSISDFDESRRRILLYALSTGTLSSAFMALGGCASPASSITSLTPSRLAAGQSIYQIDGDVRINGKKATLSTQIQRGDTVETQANSFAIFVVGKDAFILRSNSSLSLPVHSTATQAVSTQPVSAQPLSTQPKLAAGKSTQKINTSSSNNVFSLTRGKVLSVLASRRTQISTPSAVIGIRGTGVYIEVEPERSYVCTCYGLVDLATSDDPSISETIQATHHDAPRYILADKSQRNRIQPAPFKDHDDQELLLIETLVGRTAPYVVPKSVTRSRRRYY